MYNNFAGCVDFAYLWSCIEKGLRSTGLPGLIFSITEIISFLYFILLWYSRTGSFFNWYQKVCIADKKKRNIQVF